MSNKSLHYAWIIVLSGIFTLFSCLGLGRFALGMLLPAMGENLSLSYTQMGFISTGNFIGYLAAVLICGRVIKKLGERRAIALGLLTVGGSMLAVGFSSEFLIITLLYFITGLGSGMANITAMSLVAHWFSARYRGRAAGYMIVGNGIGIVTSGLLIPWLNLHWLSEGWRYGWSIFGIMVLLSALIAALFIRNHPRELNLSPLGTVSDAPSVSTSPDKPSPDIRRLVAHIGGIYFMFGFTYVIYATFIVTTLVEQYHFSEARAGLLWTLIGILSIASGALFGWVSDHFGRKAGLMSVFALQTMSYLLAAAELGAPTLYLSMALFGITAFSIPAIIAATVSDMMPPMEAGKVFGYVTFFFGIGQIAGPTLAGYLAEYSNSFSPGYMLAGGVTAVATGLSALLKRPHQHETTPVQPTT